MIFILNLIAYYPGGISADDIDRWNQITTGEYNNWHPAIHTMLLWLVTRIFFNYSFVVAFQILCFSLLAGYMVATLAAWGIQKGWCAAFLVVLISPVATRNIMLLAWKDCAFTILVLCLAVYMVNIVFSNGQWLQKWYNSLAAAIVAALASMVRHNGFFFTLPLGILALILYMRKTAKAIYTFAATVALILFINFVLYPLVGVELDSGQTHVESVGLPMTVLSGVMANRPELLDDETKEFMGRIASEEEFAATYLDGNYNSIKWDFHASAVVQDVPISQILSMTMRTIANAPRESLLQLIALTRVVWNPLDWQPWIEINFPTDAMGVVFSGEEIASMQPIKTAINQFYTNVVDAAINLLSPSRILATIGLHMLLLLIAGVYSVNRNLGPKALLLFLPSAAYNFGTMLLLCGPDYRFFHFNTVISVALAIALLAKVTITPPPLEIATVRWRSTTKEERGNP